MAFLPVAALLAMGASAAAAATPPPPPMDTMFSVLWRKPLVEPYLLEYKPAEYAGPAVDPLTGMVVVATRDGYIQAFAQDGKELWHQMAKGPYLAPPIVADDLVIIGGIDGRVNAHARGDGTLRWTYQIREEIGTQGVVAGDLVYFATLEGTLLALDVRTGKFVWNFRREPSGRFTILGASRPAVVDGVVYKGFGDGSVVALDARTGALKWDRKVGRGEYPDVDGAIQVAGNRVFAASYGGPVMALDRADGSVAWETRVPFAYRTGIDANQFYVVTTTEVVALDVASGKRLWSAALDGAPFGAPVVAQGFVMVPNGKGLLVLDRRSGKRLRLFTRGSGASGSPAILGKRVYVLSNQGELVAVELR